MDHPIPIDLTVRYEKACAVVRDSQGFDLSGKPLSAVVVSWATSDKELIERIAAADASAATFKAEASKWHKNWLAEEKKLSIKSAEHLAIIEALTKYCSAQQINAITGAVLTARGRATGPQPCANCGMPYTEHGCLGTCPNGSSTKWFPQLLADAMNRREEIRNVTYQLSLLKLMYLQGEHAEWRPHDHERDQAALQQVIDRTAAHLAELQNGMKASA